MPICFMGVKKYSTLWKITINLAIDNPVYILSPENIIKLKLKKDILSIFYITLVSFWFMNTFRNFYLPMAILVGLFLIVQFGNLNQSLFLNLNHAAQFMPIQYWGYITFLGDGMMAGCILAVIFRKNPRIAFMGILAVFGSGIIVQVLKSYFSIPRPAGILSLDEFYQFGEILKFRGFPSGHSSTAFSLLGTFFYAREDNKRGVLFFFAALLIVFSRIAIGVHWPVDILAGSMIGLTTIYLISIKLRTYTLGFKVELATGIFLLLICISILFYDPRMPGMQMLQWIFGIGGTTCIISRFYSARKN